MQTITETKSKIIKYPVLVSNLYNFRDRCTAINGIAKCTRTRTHNMYAYTLQSTQYIYTATATTLTTNPTRNTKTLMPALTKNHVRISECVVGRYVYAVDYINTYDVFRLQKSHT